MALSDARQTRVDAARLREAAEPLFAAAVAQGMHTPFALNCDQWGREYADKLVDALGLYEDEDRERDRYRAALERLEPILTVMVERQTLTGSSSARDLVRETLTDAP